MIENMANYANLKTAIQQYIKQNGNEEITGAILQTTLLSMVDSLASGYLFKGIARPLFAPATTDGPTFYIALEAGSYINFTLTELGATAILRDGYFGIFKTSGGSSNWTFTEVAISIKDGIVTTSKITNGAVTTDKIANGAVDTAKIAEHTIRWENMDQGAVDEDILQDNSVSENKIKDGAVTEYKLGTNSVSTRSIKNGAVTDTKIYPKSVTMPKLGEDVIEELDNKANINGSYESMSVGMSKNIEATSEISGTSLYRPTAGNADVADGVARVLKIGGNATPWNQQITNGDFSNGVGSWACGSAVLSVSNNILTLTLNGSYNKIELVNASCGQQIANHIYAHFIQINPSRVITSAHKSYQGTINNIPANTWTNYVSIISRQEVVGPYDLYMFSSWEQGDTVQIKNIMLFDLTLMFGAGNEPATPEAFEAWLQANVGLRPYYPYNAGELLSTKMLGIKTVGFNQWDEEWENAYLDGNNKHTSDLNSICSVNYQKCFAATQYYCNRPQGYLYAAGIAILWYDSNKNFIYRDFAGNGTVLTSPANAAYFKISGYQYGTTYNHDICINLHYTNGRDGEYEQYVEHQYDFDVTKIYGKSGGEGELVQIFPNGMRGISYKSYHAADVINIKERTATVLIGSNDLTNIGWVPFGNTIFYTANLDNILKSSTPAICVKYAYNEVNVVDKTLCVRAGNGKTYINDSSYEQSGAGAAALKASLNGVNLYQELIEPLVYTDLVYRDNGVDTPIDALNILVSNYGTEEQIVESPTNGEPNSCAATLDILYGVNAADFMDAANNGAFVSKASLDALCNTLGSALGGTLTSTWNSAEGHYDFTFTPATRQIENPENNE